MSREDGNETVPHTQLKHYHYKVLLIGPWGAGKTSLIRKYVEEKFVEDYLPTIGASVMVKDIAFKVNGEDVQVNLMIWDIAAQETFKLMRYAFYAGANGAFIVADLARIQSFEQAQEWADDLGAKVPECPIIFLANKADLEYFLDDKFIQEIADKMGAVKIFKTSALNGENVQEAFRYLTSIMIK
jgi:small GTP-binding protein